MDSKEQSPSPTHSLLDDIVQGLREFPPEFARCWHDLPKKGVFFLLLSVCLLFFQYLGNATFGYVDTTSIMYWMYNAYNNIQSDGPDSHGNHIPFVVLVLFWLKRKELLALRNRAWAPGLLLLAGALFLQLVGYSVQQPLISIVAMFAGIYALMGLAWGPQWLKASFFPFFLFAFCIPMSALAEPIAFPLRNLAAKIVVLLSNGLLGFNVIREGTMLFNSKHTYSYEIATACSGLRSLVATFAIATIYGFLNFDKAWKRILMMAAAFPLAVIGNVLRLL